MAAIVAATLLLGACRPCDWLLASCDDDDGGDGQASCTPPEEAENVAGVVICDEDDGTSQAD